MAETTSPTTKPEPLTAAFEPADRNAWRALAEKALKGADFEKRLVSKTADGVRVEPIYARDTFAIADTAPATAPFTRGTDANVSGLGWQIHQFVTDADPQQANRTLLAELEAGANGAVVQVAGPGQPGVAIKSTADLVTTLTGTYLDYAPVQVRAGLRDTEIANLFLEALAGLGAKPGDVLALLNLDPIGNWARYGGTSTPIDTAIKNAVSLAQQLRATAPKVRTINIDATIAHEAGASEGQELAYAAGCLVAYLKAFEDAGVAPQDAFAHCAFTLSTDDDIFTSLAKLRAARRIICRIAEAAGVDQQTIKSLHITARTSERMLAKRDPWTNILRTTVACAAAAFAGTEAITVHPFTWALGEPDAFARRIARNTQIICQEESSLGRVIDPAGGSWYIDSLTNDLAELAWTEFQAIERDGGLIAVLKNGSLQTAIAATRAQREKQVAKRQQALTGVSEFPLLGADGVKVTPWPGHDGAPNGSEITALEPHRLAEPFEALRDAADRIADKNDGKPPQIFLASIGRIVDHNTRSTWVKNLLAAGGIEALTNDGFDDADAIANAYKESGATAACICSSDELYANHAADTAKALRAAGASLVLMAGKPVDNEDALTAAGVDMFLYQGLDIVATLSNLLKSLKP